jgi:tetratricopeptide (TPR) repeat protein
MLQPVMSIRDWMKTVKQHLNDHSWLAQHESDLYSLLKNGLQRPPTFHDAVDLLMFIIPHYAFTLYHHKQWMPLLLEGLLQAQLLGDNEMQIQILTQLGESYMNGSQNAAAREAFNIALERAHVDQPKAMMLAVYIGLIRIQYLNIIGGEPDPDLFVKALKLEREVDDLALKAGLHAALSLAYIKAAQTTALAIGHGQTAYVYWYRLNNKLEMAKTAYLIAAAYRFAGQIDAAQQWLGRASALFEKTGYNRQYTILAYEQGSLYVQQKHFEVAEQWLNMALDEAIQIGSVDYEACAYHALGIAQTGLGQYATAENSLKRALAAWETVGDTYELANAYHAMGNLHRVQKDYAAAIDWFDRALIICEKIPQPVQRAFMEKHIRDTIDEIPPAAPA